MRKILLTLLCFVALAALVGCGGGSSSTQVPPPPGSGNNAGYSNASLSGTYVFTAQGVNNSNGNSFAIAGIFTADGAGNISSGSRDTVQDNGSQNLSESITGTYSVNQDGRGQLILNGGATGKVIYRFVMESKSVAKLFQEDITTTQVVADAVGKIQLQSGLSNGLGSSPYIFTLNGEDTKLYPFASVGALTIGPSVTNVLPGGSGPVTGTVDENDWGTLTPQLAATGTYSIGGTGRGTLSYTTASGTHNFIVYQVSPSRLEVISTDKNFWLVGYASSQNLSQANPVAWGGAQVFSLSGVDSNFNPIAEAGRMVLDGAGGINSGLDDVNDAGNLTSALAFTGTYTVGSGGRFTASVGTISTSLIGWQVTPSESVLLTNGSSVLQTGVLRSQDTTLTNASIKGNYAHTLSGVYLGGGYVEITGNYLADGAGNFSGTFDSQTPSGDYTDNATTGTYSIQSTGRSTGSVDGVATVLYAANANTIYLVSGDPTRVYSGKLVKQQ
jgi:hypothetical protein